MFLPKNSQSPLAIYYLPLSLLPYERSLAIRALLLHPRKGHKAVANDRAITASSKANIARIPFALYGGLRSVDSP